MQTLIHCATYCRYVYDVNLTVLVSCLYTTCMDLGTVSQESSDMATIH